jgi:hypothetical protein
MTFARIAMKQPLWPAFGIFPPRSLYCTVWAPWWAPELLHNIADHRAALGYSINPFCPARVHGTARFKKCKQLFEYLY